MILLTIIAVLFILAFSITIHEFGHFIIAKLAGIPVEKFSLGFGPPIIRIKIGETDFRIAYFPLGGYVKFAGDDEGEVIKPLLPTTEPNVNAEPPPLTSVKPGFYDAPIYKRIAVIFSGPLFNIVSSFLIFAFIFIVFGVMVNPYLKINAAPDSYAARQGFVSGDSIIAVNGQGVNHWDKFLERLSEKENPTTTVTLIRNQKKIDLAITAPADSLDFQPLIPPVFGFVRFNGPAYKAGMKTGDRVTYIDNREIKTWNEMVEIIRRSRRKNLIFEWTHHGETRKTTIVPGITYDPFTKDTIGQIGVMMPLQRQYIPIPMSIAMSFRRSVDITWLILKTLYRLITGEISRKTMGGPIAIARMSGESASWGIDNLLGLLAVISINLGLVNLFPLPAFDGGQILIALFEGIRRKRLSRKTRLVLQQIGYALILLLIIYVTYNDITR